MFDVDAIILARAELEKVKRGLSMFRGGLKISLFIDFSVDIISSSGLQV